MLINLRNALMAGKRLPYDSEVEYLETDGSAYINTGAKIYNDTFVVVVWYSNYSTSTASYFFGSDSSTDRFYFREYNGNASFSTGSWWQNTNISTVGTHTIEMSSNGISVDGTASSRTGAAKTGDGNFCLFKVAAGNSPSGMRCYSCKIYQNDTLVRDYIPVRKGTVGYLYDRVSGKLFGKAGTGDFVVGPDVVPVEWLQSSGWEYIDTGAIPDDTTGIEAVHTICPNNGTDNIIFGARQDSGNTRYWIDIDWGGGGGTIGWGFNTYSAPSSRFSLKASYAGRVVTNSLNYMNDRAGKIDGVTYDSSLQSKTLATMNRSVYLFGANYQGTVGFRGIFKVYSAKISKGQTLVNNFLPIRVGTGSSWEGAMMDTLTRRIYRNAGTGAFAYGNDLKYPIPAE